MLLGLMPPAYLNPGFAMGDCPLKPSLSTVWTLDKWLLCLRGRFAESCQGRCLALWLSPSLGCVISTIMMRVAAKLLPCSGSSALLYLKPFENGLYTSLPLLCHAVPLTIRRKQQISARIRQTSSNHLVMS